MTTEQSKQTYAVFPPEAVIDGDRLNVTIERAVADYGNHLTVRAHLSVTVPAPRLDELMGDYQTRIEGAINDLAYPLKRAVLNEVGIPFEERDGLIHELIPLTKDAKQDAAVQETMEQVKALPKAQPKSQASSVRVRDKSMASTKGPSYGLVNPGTLKPWFDPYFLEVAETKGVDTVFTGVSERDGRRWYKIDGEFVNKPREDTAPPSVADDEEPF